MANDLEKLGKIALGVLGGYFLIELLKNFNKCKSCGNKIPPNHNHCPYCGTRR